MATRKKKSLDSNRARFSSVATGFQVYCQVSHLSSKCQVVQSKKSLAGSFKPSTLLHRDPGLTYKTGTLGPGWHLLLASKDVKETTKKGPKTMKHLIQLSMYIRMQNR